MSTLSQIAAGLEALRRRERRLLLARTTLLEIAGLLLVWSVVLVAVVRRVDSTAIQLVAGGLLVIGAIVAAAWTVRRWKDAGDPVRQARAVESLDAEIRGRLILSAERPDGPVGQESPSLLERAARKALWSLNRIAPDAVHPAAQLRAPAGAAGGSLLLLLGLGWWLPLGPIAALAALFSTDAEATSLEKKAEAESDERALVGEIVLRYEYPEYTGMEPLEVPNSNGTAHGPPGTVVTVKARTAEIYDEAALQVDDTAPVSAALTAGRDLESQFVIASEGVYRFLLRRGAGEAQLEERSPDYAIEVEADLAPTVEVEAPRDRLQVSWDEVIPVEWTARDDYGVQEVSVRVGGGEPIQLRKPLDSEPTLRGFLGKTPDELGLQPGDRATLEIEATDNDAISGAKAGQSRQIEVVVLGPRGQARRTLKLRRELRDTLVDVLADFVTDPDPPARQQRELVAWGEDVSGRFEPLDALVDEYWDAVDAASLEGLIVEEIRRLGGGLLRFVQSAADPRAATPVAAQDLQTVQGLRADLVEQLESAILMLDKMVRYQALGELNVLAAQTADTATLLEERSEAGADYGEILSRMSTLDRQETKLAQAARAYDGGQLTEFVLRSLEDAGYIEDRIREHVAATEDELARRRVRDLGEAMRRMAAGVEYMRRQAEEQNQEMEDQLEDFIKELERLETEELELVERTDQALEQHGGGQDALISAWESVERLSGALSTHTRAAADAVSASESSLWTGRAETAADQATRLHQAVQARDLQGAAIEATRARLRVEQSLRTFQFTELAPAGALQSTARSAEIARQLDEALRSLDALMNTAGPELMAASRGLSREQAELIPPTDDATDQARQLAPELPMGAPGLVESMEGALREMARSEKALGQGRAVEGKGAEQAAADHIRQAIESLSQAAQALEQLQQAMQQPSGEGEGDQQSADGGDGENLSNQEIDIPPPEAFETPEAYRQALLEGMQAEVPPEYEALKRRYYEELVRQ